MSQNGPNTIATRRARTNIRLTAYPSIMIAAVKVGEIPELLRMRLAFRFAVLELLLLTPIERQSPLLYPKARERGGRSIGFLEKPPQVSIL